MIQVLVLIFSVSVFSSSLFKCDANYDQLGIPHQKIDSMEQYYYCFGYHHGKDRAWEMDYFKRAASGRNAEIYGFSNLKSDLMMRLLDLPSLAQRIYADFPIEHKEYLMQYSAGVNEGFKIGSQVHEFVDKGYSPETWEPKDSVLVLLLQSFDQTRKTFWKEYEEEKWLEDWKEKAGDLFSDDEVPWFNTIIKEGEYLNKKVEKISVKTSSYTPKLWSTFPTVFGEESGSNNWVISSKKSKTGHAMLANDPHLDLKTPLFWYWIHLKTPDNEVIGASVPGVPFIASGTNGKVAWGLTNSYFNSADAFYVEDAPKDFYESVRPTVKVKIGFLKIPFFLKSFERTKSGLPVLPLETEKNQKMALVWSGFFLKPEDITPMFDLIKLKNVDEVDKALQKVGVPSWNYVFADTKGNIGYRVVGKLFKEEEKSPFGVQLKKASELTHPRFLTPQEVPQVLRPKREYVYSANNRHWPSDSAYYGGRGYSFSFRGFRIDELLKDQKHDRESFSKIQCDRQAVDARFFVPEILKHIEVKEFKNWDYLTVTSSTTSAIYRRFMDKMMEEWKVNEYALYRLIKDADKNQIEMMQKILKQARAEVNGRTWGDFHRLTFAHLSKNGDWSFSPELPGLGDNHSVDPGTSKWNDDRKIYEQYSGASMRMIIELKEKPVIHLSLPGHNRDYQTNKIFSPWEGWIKCEYSQLSLEI